MAVRATLREVIGLQLAIQSGQPNAQAVGRCLTIAMLLLQGLYNSFAFNLV